MNKMKLKPWNIKQLYQAMIEDLNLCQTDLERQLCKTICKKEIREKAKEFKKTRRLTPFEQAILETIYQTIKQKKTKYIMNNTNTTYNGWTNYETWRINLELFNGDDEHWSHGSPDGMREFAELLIEESTDEGIGRDYALAFLQNVNWQEIAEYYEVNEEEEDVA